MKKIRNTVPTIVFSIIVLLIFISALATYVFIGVQLATHYPELWESLNKDNPWEDGIFVGIVKPLTALVIIAAIIFGVIFVTHKVLTSIANHALGCIITEERGEHYPKRYYISKTAYTDEDRRRSVQDFWGCYYFRAYTVVIEFTPEEMKKILSFMDLNGELYYELPKSFLMPDNISWLHPKMSFRTVRRIVRNLPSDGAVLLEYKYEYPKKSQITRTPAKIRIKANLHCPTYTSKDVFIGHPNDND